MTYSRNLCQIVLVNSGSVLHSTGDSLSDYFRHLLRLRLAGLPRPSPFSPRAHRRGSRIGNPHLDSGRSCLRVHGFQALDACSAQCILLQTLVHCRRDVRRCLDRMRNRCLLTRTLCGSCAYSRKFRRGQLSMLRAHAHRRSRHTGNALTALSAKYCLLAPNQATGSHGAHSRFRTTFLSRRRHRQWFRRAFGSPTTLENRSLDRPGNSKSRLQSASGVPTCPAGKQNKVPGVWLLSTTAPPVVGRWQLARRLSASGSPLQSEISQYQFYLFWVKEIL